MTSATYNIVHDGRIMGPIIPSRGIRQGYPLSPYLFILCAEGLSALIRWFEQKGWIHGCKVANGAPRVSHMLFADDSYLYCKATLQEAHKFQELLSLFEKTSGQKVNLGKSSIFFSTNTCTTLSGAICIRLQMRMADDRSLYLGLPSTLSRNKTVVFGYLKDRIQKRVEGWDKKFLSRAGKEILVKTVAQSIPSYAMGVFLLPKDLSRNMEQQLAKFWWKSSGGHNKGVRWMAWDRLTLHKDMGGLGFRSLYDFNLALLGKQAWRLLTRPDSLVARIFKARYYPSCSFLSASIGNNPSYVWRSILAAKDIVQMGVRWSVGDGANIEVLHSPWLPDVDDPTVISTHPGLVGTKVQQLMQPEIKQWDVELIRDLFQERDAQLILGIPLSPSQVEDHLMWVHEISGLYSVKSAYKLIQKQQGRWESASISAVCKHLWKLKLPPKVKNLVWRAISKCLPTMDHLRMKRIDVNPLCQHCGIEEESTFHALVTCLELRQVWDRVGVGTTDGLSNFEQWVDYCFKNFEEEKQCRILSVCWAVWGARNHLVWNKKSTPAVVVLKKATDFLHQWTSAQSSDLESPPSLALFGDGAASWTPPTEGIKINIDATIFMEQFQYGLGLVARDARGFLIEGVTILRCGQIEPLIAEAVGMWEVLSWIKRCQWNHVMVESDCIVLVQALRSNVIMLSDFGRIIDDCRMLLKQLLNISVYFVKHSANMVANEFARASILYPDRMGMSRFINYSCYGVW